MSKRANEQFSGLLDGQPANKFDAKTVLQKRRESRRLTLPWVPICAFGFELDETKNEGGPLSEERAADSAGAEMKTQN